MLHSSFRALLLPLRRSPGVTRAGAGEHPCAGAGMPRRSTAGSGPAAAAASGPAPCCARRSAGAAPVSSPRRLPGSPVQLKRPRLGAAAALTTISNHADKHAATFRPSLANTQHRLLHINETSPTMPSLAAHRNVTDDAHTCACCRALRLALSLAVAASACDCTRNWSAHTST